MFFQSDYNDLMPPEPETGGETPEKTGFARFLELVGTHCHRSAQFVRHELRGSPDDA